MRYNPALDGLRAVAVILVLCNHTMQKILPLAGWIGVDIFFVLSGYLITSILLRELRETGRISFSNFYGRRALRLVPALAIVAISQIVLSVFSHRGAEIREATLVGVTYLENWNMIYGWWPVGYMGATWSLSVEEQFYLLWPLTLVFLANKLPLVWIAYAVLAMTIAELIFWRGGGAGTEHTLQFSLGIRPVGLLIGSALTFLPTIRWRIPSLMAPSMLLIIGAVVMTADRSDLVFLAAPMVVSLATAVLIICTNQIGSGSIAVLSTAPLRYVGKISYGIYLYHVPIFFLGEEHKIHLPGYLFGTCLIVLVFVTAALSYEFVEKPILRLKDRLGGTPDHPHAGSSSCQLASNR
jgi:peptidoglycan/LPS O-acetylase OafA/YrhL